MTRFYLEIDDNESAIKYLKEVETLKSIIEEKENDLVDDHPEVLVCKAYSMSACSEYSSNLILKTQIIEIYEKALR